MEKILYGGDYNPDQWLEHPEILEKDLEYMLEAKINTVTLGIFSWSGLEPSEGEYHLDWLETIVNHLYDNGISTIMATPSGARPKWLADRYPEVLRVGENRVRNLFGRRHNHCYTSPVYREKVGEIDRRLAERFAQNPAVIMWHISNELGGECHCPLCQEAFRQWVRKEYGTIEEVNRCWYTTFWSHTYQSFEQIESPSSIGETAVHGLNLAWKRFVTEQTADFTKHEVDVLKAAGVTKPVTVNLMYDYQGLNYDKLAQCVDVVSWDSYPVWHKGEDILTAWDNGFQHDYIRSLKHQPFLLMESCPSSTNWQGVSKLKRPGLLEAASLQAVAHGSDSVLYFQIRQSRGSSEKFHGAVIDHSGSSDTRVFKEIKRTGAALEKLEEIKQTTVKARAAIIYDTENQWAMKDAQGPRNDGMFYREAVMKSYRAMRKLGLSVDVISQQQDISGYKLVAAPMLYLFKEGVEEKIRNFVARGGSFVLTYWSGIVDDNDLCFLGDTPYGLTDVFGMKRNEIDGLYNGEVNHLVPAAGGPFTKTYECRNLCDLMTVHGADTWMVYGDEFYEGTPAVVKNRFETGTSYYVGADAEQGFYDELYAVIAADCEIPLLVEGTIPDGVEVSSRVNEAENVSYLFIQNYNNAPVDISGMGVTGEVLIGTEEEILKAYETVVVKVK